MPSLYNGLHDVSPTSTPSYLPSGPPMQPQLTPYRSLCMLGRYSVRMLALAFFFVVVDPLPPTSGFPGGAHGKEPACQCRRLYKRQIRSLGWEDLLEEVMATHSSLLA